MAIYFARELSGKRGVEFVKELIRKGELELRFQKSFSPKTVSGLIKIIIPATIVAVPNSIIILLTRLFEHENLR